MRITVSIMAICFAVLLMQQLLPWLTIYIALTPVLALNGMYWQFFTYMFAHASISHAGFNMLGLFIFGVTMEQVLGARRYLALYLASGVGSGLFHILLTGISDIPMLGASGAVFAVLAAYAIKFPDSKIMIFPIIFPIKALYAVIGFVVFSLFAGFTGLMPGIANFGHVGGMVFGASMMLFWRWRDRGRADVSLEDMDWKWDAL